MIATQKNVSSADWDGTGVPDAPTAPESLKQAGLSLNFLNDLLLRTLYVQGVMLGLDLARNVCLPFKVIEESLKFLKDEKCVEVQGGDLIGRVSYRFQLTELGRKRAQDSMKQCAYIGPAPVELNLEMLDLRFNSDANFYQAPIQVKANGGVFLIDDFGRQLCSPKELLNRWILPLEDRHDFLTIASGKKFEVPFEQLIIFSTNLDPKDLVDDAFLRRIRHKVCIDAPQRDIYEKIFNGMVKRLGMNICPDAVDYLYERYYSQGRNARASDCRDLLEIVQAICRFRRQPVQLTRELMAEAANSFICEF
jgi:hypothetical protein